MASLNRIRVAVRNFQGGPGVLTLCALDAPAMLSSLNTWLAAQMTRLPQYLAMQIENSGDIFESTSGEVTGVWTDSVQTVHTSSTASVYAGGVGYVVHWKTATYLSGRLLRGRSFLVPAVGGCFQNDGTIVDATLASIQSTADTLVAAAADNFVVWQRPRPAKDADGSRPAVTYRAGGYAPVVTASSPDRGVFLTSRRT